MALTEQKLKEMNDLARAIALKCYKSEGEKLLEIMKAHEDWPDNLMNEDFIKAISKLIGVYYRQGFADCYENYKVKQLIF